MEKLELLKDEKTGNWYLWNGNLWYCSPIVEFDENVPKESFVEVDDQDEIKKYLQKEMPVFSEKLFNQLGQITVEQAENGEGLKIAKKIYEQAVKIGDDTTANEAYSYIKMFESNALLVAKRLFDVEYEKVQESARVLLKSLNRLFN